MTITIYFYGSLNSVSEIAEYTGPGTGDEAARLMVILSGANPRSISGYPSSFNPCGNVLADIYELDAAGHDFELVELKENADYYPGCGDDQFVVPESGAPYLRSTGAII